MPYLTDAIECCGINELSGIEWDDDEAKVPTSHQCVMGARSVWKDHPFIFFSSAQPCGTKLMNDIRKHKLGTVWCSQPKRNPGESPNLRMFVWCPDWEAMDAYKKAMRDENGKANRPTSVQG